MSDFYGKYRGKVEANKDPKELGRLQVSCPAVLGDGRNSWALPSTPYAGDKVGLFVIPPVGANVWVEFEGGDPDYPIWSGCFWGNGQVPASPAVPETKMLKTDAMTLTIDDTSGSGGVTIEVKSPAVTSTLKISMTSSGIELSNGASKVTLTTTSVSVNDGALEVM